MFGFPISDLFRLKYLNFEYQLTGIQRFEPIILHLEYSKLKLKICIFNIFCFCVSSIQIPTLLPYIKVQSSALPVLIYEIENNQVKTLQQIEKAKFMVNCSNNYVQIFGL